MDEIVFIGDWVKDRVLGSGSFGTVVLWKHKSTDEKLAIKTCKWSDELTAKHRERWTNEVEMLQTCTHPNLVGTRDLPEEFVKGLEKVNPSKLPILCMEYCSGGDLRQLLNKPESCVGLKELQVRQILSDICDAIKFLHLNKITHRDLKPENIVMHVQESPALLQQKKIICKLIDLGYAKEIDSKSVCASFVGTLQYLAPEIMYSKSYSNSVDYWSFGLLAFEITCGVRPFLPFMSPVQWMPEVKKKAHDNICVYETFHGDIEYSNELFPENHISKAFKVALEDWLKIALEWDPKLRGRDAPSKVTFAIPKEQQAAASNVVLFSLMENILSTKIIKIFSVPSLLQYSYKIDEETTIATLKDWLQNDTKISIQDQIIISQTSYVDIANDELVAKYWSENCNTMLYLYNKSNFFNETIEPVVPKAVQRCLEHPKTLYNYKNSQTLYRNGLYFVMLQIELYESLIHGLFTRGESLKHESKQLLLKHNLIDKTIGKLLAQEEIVMKMAEIGRQHIQNIRDSGMATNYLGGFEKIFADADELSDKINKLETAWGQVSVRLQSAARRSNESLSTELNNFVSKFNYHTIHTNAIKAYITYKRSEFFSETRREQRQCQDIVKICYECLKVRSKIMFELQRQPFILKFMNLSTEFAKIADAIAATAENTDKLVKDLTSLNNELTNCTWSTLSVLATDAENLGDLPYSVVSFRKENFKIGEVVSKDCIKVTNGVNEDDRLRSLVEESLSLRKNQSSLNEKLNMQKKILDEASYDFSFLKEN